MVRYLEDSKSETPSLLLCLKEQGVKTGFPELANTGGRMAAPDKLGSQKNSHRQNAERPGRWRTGVNTLDLFFLLPSRFLLVSLIS